MQKRAVPGALKDSSNSMQHGSRAWSKPNAARPTTAPSAAEQAQVPSASGDTAYFLGFVQLLASKTPEEQQMLMQMAIAEANGTGTAIADAAGGVAGRGLRRSASAAEMRNKGALAQINARYGSAQARGGSVGVASAALLRGPTSSIEGRPQSAEAPTANARTGGTWAGANQLSVSLNLKKRQAAAAAAAGRPQVSIDAMRAKLQAQLSRRWAVTTLQSHWRGWQHRRFVRFLRARRKRHRRLDYLWHLDYMNRLMLAHGACKFIQSHWRACRDRRAIAAATLAAATAAAARRAHELMSEVAGDAAAASSAGNPAEPAATTDPAKTKQPATAAEQPTPSPPTAAPATDAAPAPDVALPVGPHSKSPKGADSEGARGEHGVSSAAPPLSVT